MGLWGLSIEKAQGLALSSMKLEISGMVITIMD